MISQTRISKLNGLFVFYLVVFLFPIVAFGQLTKIEEYISLDSENYSLSNVSYQDLANRIIEKREIDYNGKTTNDWTSLSKLHYEDTLLIKIESKSKINPTNLIIGLNFYDINQNKIKTIVTQNNDTIFQINFIYNIKHQLIEENITLFIDYFGEDTMPQKTKKQYVYLDDKLIEEWVLENNKKTEHYKYEYKTEKNRQISEKNLLDEINYLEKQKFIELHNESNQLIEDYTYFNDGTLFRKHKYEYNQDNQLIEILEFGNNLEKPIVSIKYKYTQIEQID